MLFYEYGRRRDRGTSLFEVILNPRGPTLLSVLCVVLLYTSHPTLLYKSLLVGLLSNAVEATPPGGEITVRAQAADGGIELAVADRGAGIAPELRSRVFEPFFTTRPNGTGLGLAVARQIVEAHGGRIDVRDRPGGGACFTIRLPAAA